MTFINFIVKSYEKDKNNIARKEIVYYEMKDTKQFFLLLAFKLHRPTECVLHSLISYL